MSAYTYHGLPQTVPLKIGAKKDKDGALVGSFQDFAFAPGREISGLPEDNPIIMRMIATEELKPAPAKASPPKPKGDK